jgi:beta-glucosidase
MTLRAAILAITLGLAVTGSASAAGRCGNHPWCDTSLSPDARATLLLKAMTQDEKTAFIGGDDLSGVLGGDGTHTGTQTGIPRLDVPTVYYSDGPQGSRSGEATAMPGPMALAASFDPKLAEAYGSTVANEVKLKGNDVVFAPTINLMRTPLGGRTFEGYGEDPFLIGNTAAGWIKGAQSQGVIADVKHFAFNQQEGVGAAPVGTLGASGPGSRMLVNANVDERTMHETELVGFEDAVKAGVGTVMCSYNQVNGAYACENAPLIKNILEHDWGFKGYVLSDYGASHDTINNLNNGLDFEPWPGESYGPDAVSAAVASGQVSQQTLDEHIFRILRTWFQFGVFDHPTIPYDNSKIDQAGHKQLAGQVDEQAITLLKNAGNALPLDASKLKRVALIGSDADSFKNRGGSAGITPFAVTTPRQGITERVGSGVNVTYDDGSDASAAAADAKAADVAIVFASDSSIEGKDKTCLNLTCPTDATAPTLSKDVVDQDSMIQNVAAAQKNTIVVLETGGPVLTPWRDQVPAIVEAWDPGEDGGHAIAHMLFGDVDPGGRLPVTFPNALADEPTSGDPEKYPGIDENVYYKEGVFVGYRWFDQHKLTVAFPFGYGLSYTNFAFSNLALDERAGKLVASFDVRNTGSRPGWAVPELYIAMPSSKDVPQPPEQLKGYSKLQLDPGKTKRVSIVLDDRAFSYWDTKSHGWQVAPGCYGLSVGSSSRDLALRTVVARDAGCPGSAAIGAVLPARASRCSSGRRFLIRLPKAMRRATVTYAGHTVRAVRVHGRLRASIDLRGLRAGTFVVHVRGFDAHGKVIRQVRVFRTCARCTTKHVVTLRLARGLKSATVTFAGRKVRAHRVHGRLVARLNLRGLKQRRVGVRIVGRTASGKRVHSSRIVRICGGN